MIWTRLLVIVAVTAALGILLVWLLRRVEAHVPSAWAATGTAALRAARGPVFVLVLLGGLLAAVRALDLDPESTATLGLLLIALAIMAVAWFAAALARRVTLVLLAREGGLPNATLFGHLAWATAISLGSLIAMGTLGVSITPLLTALGVGGLAVALALQPTLTNLFAGVQVLASGQVRPGDYVRLSSGDEGYVADVTWRQTTIRALSNNLVIVPNAQLASAVLTNFHLPGAEMAVLVHVGVAYDSDLERVERVTAAVGREVMREVPGGVTGFEPFIRYNAFADSSIDFNVILRAHEFVDQFLITHEFIKRLHARYATEGIVIPYPIRTVVMPSSGADSHVGER